MRFFARGGKRAGAGRKRTRPGRPCVPHRARPRHHHAHPVHVTLRVRAGLPSLRHEGVFAFVRAGIARASRAAFRVVEFSIQDDHAHFIVEAHDKAALSSGVRGLAIRLAKAINRAMGLSGGVWGDRYHARDLKTPRAVRNALVYVLMNAKKHRVRIANGIDTFSSAPWFFGVAVDDAPVVLARTWLGAAGWRRRGAIRAHDRPSAPS